MRVYLNQYLNQGLSWIRRERIILLISCLALVQGAKQSWYSLPPTALDTFKINSALLNFGRGLAALLVILSIGYILFSKWNRLFRLLSWGALIITLLFPYAMITWCPNVNFLATSYYEQGQQVAHHVERNFSQIQAQWKQNISLDRAIPISSTAPFSIKDSRFFQASSWDQLIVEGLGYSNSFLGFIGRGWVMTLVGLGLCLFALYLALHQAALAALKADFYWLSPGAGLIIVLLLISLLLPNFVNYHLGAEFAKGNYAQVLSQSRSLLDWYPPLRGDPDFLQRLAQAGFYAGNPDPALLSFAKGLEADQNEDFLAAELYFREALEREPDRFLARGFLASALLNQGINIFNAVDRTVGGDGRPASAVERFEQALQVFPEHIEALYDLMLSTVVNGEFAKSAQVAQQVIASQHYPQQPNLALLGQARLHLAWSSYQHQDLKQAWEQYRQSTDPATWEKTPSREPQITSKEEGQ
jgi:tetratricopeptide (TPR) repeat protein